MTLDATINPDFSQIESDAAQIDVNSAFALSFPERRAFFQEGADLFETEIDVVYTRSINDPIAASKLSGRFGNWTLGYIGARDITSPILVPFEESSRLASGGKSVSNIFRARRSFKNNSFLAGTVTDRRLDEGGSGTVAGVDGMIRLSTQYRVSWQALVSHTSELNDAELSAKSGLSGVTFDRGKHTGELDGERFSGTALSAGVGKDGRNYGFDVTFEQLSPTFRADNGFIFNNDVRRFNGGANLSVRATNRMTLSSNLNYSRLRNKETHENFFSGYIVRSRLNYQFTRKLLTRIIVQYNDFSESLEVDPLITYRVSPFTVFHFGSSHRYQDFPNSVDGQQMVFQQTNRQVFFKLQYLFRM